MSTRNERQTASFVGATMVVVVALLAGLVGLAVRAPTVQSGAHAGNGARPTARPTPTPTGPPAGTIPTGQPSARPKPIGPITVAIGVSLPLSGPDAERAVAIRNGVQLAVDKATSQGVARGVTFKLVTLDHAVGAAASPEKAAKDMAALVADPTVMGVVGPLDASVAAAQVPVASAAHLFQCSPGAFLTGLTRDATTASLRPAAGNSANFLEIISPQGTEGFAMARYAYVSLLYGKVGIVGVVDDGTDQGKALAGSFADEYKAQGGSVAATFTLKPKTLAKDLARAKAANVEAMFVGGDAATVLTVRTAMAAAGIGGLPLLAGDGVLDGPRAQAGSYLGQAGLLAMNTWAAALPEAPPGADAVFANSYRSAFGVEPGPYSAAGYACAQVVISAVATGRDQAPQRSVIALMAASGLRFDTVLGSLAANGGGVFTPETVPIWEAVSADWKLARNVTLPTR